MKNVFCVVILLVFSISAYADSGYELLENCQEVENHEEGKALDEKARVRAAKCISYLSGFGGADALSPLTRKGRRMFCIPKDVSLTEAALVTVRWMRENEDKLKFGSHEVLAMSNIVNYPCGK